MTLVQDLFSKLSEEMGVGPPTSGSAGTSHPRAPGLLLKWVQGSASIASFLQLLTALPTSGLRQPPPLVHPQGLGRLAWPSLGATTCSPRPQVWSDSGLAGRWPGVHSPTHTHHAREKQRTSP